MTRSTRTALAARGMASLTPDPPHALAHPTRLTMRRRFITVNGRRVHYLRLGDGPPAVLVHSSPTNAWYVAPQMRLLAEHCTCFAFDTPGFGSSEALPGDHLSVAQLAAALAENMATIGLPACPVYGTHTGAAIALSLGANHPERVTALVLDGVPIFSAAELGQLFEGYFEPLAIDDRGGHYARTWTRFRDQYIWFPWTAGTPDRLNDVDLGSADALHAWTMNFFHAGHTYRPAYQAGVGYSDQAVADAAALRCPAIYTATDSDMLYPHLDRLPPLRPGQQVRRTGNDKGRKDALIGELFTQHPATGPAPGDRSTLTDETGLQQQFIDLPWGQMLLRHAGAAQAPPVVLLHDAPGSSHGLARPGGLMDTLAPRLRVLAPDLPGCAGSDPLVAPAAAHADTEAPSPPLAAWADALAALCARLGVQRACFYGVGLGASLALAVAERHPGLAAGLVLRGLALPTPVERAELKRHYAPRIVPLPDGSHWYRTWLMLRDQQIYFPWYEPQATRLRRVPMDLDGERLHEATFEVMKQHAAYHQLIDAAWAHDAATPLATLQLPMRLCHDPQVPLYAHDDRLRTACPHTPALPCEPEAHAQALAAFVAQVLARP